MRSVESPFLPLSRAERLIATGRVVLAASSLVALWWDPSEPAKFAATAYGLLAVYLLYALIIAAVVWRRAEAPRHQGIVTHCFDLGFFLAFTYFTAGPASPFTAYFVFALVCATLRWRWRGALWTALVSLGAYFALGVYFAEILNDPGFELNDLIIRSVYLAVVAVLLGYLGRHEEEVREKVARLAAWPARPARVLEEELAESLRHGAAILGARRVVARWRSVAEGTEWQADLRDGALRLENPPAANWIDDRHADAAILTGAATDAARGVLVWRDGRIGRSVGDALTEHGRDAFGDEAVLSARWRGELARGRIFLTGLAEATADELPLVEVVAALVGARIDAHLALEQRHRVAASEERVRLARDLHDGVLQSLTGVGLRLAAVRRQLEESPDAARAALESLQRSIAVEQRDLRFTIQDLEPRPGELRGFDLEARLAELVHRLEQEWKLAVELRSELGDEPLREPTDRHVYFLVREAMMNAIRHGEAKTIRARLHRPADGRLRVDIEDDGHGFPFSGTFDGLELAARGVGPRSLRERVTTLGGRLTLSTGVSGSRLELEVPA